ncbi:MAG: hypothetical protein HYS12_18910 [Planctomycetes bacterium]|nr:hypothetical protein [Planctomycetota bacterium]
MAKKVKREEVQLVGFIGVGLDNEDGHRRLTQNENFLLVGGSAETHEKMQNASIYFNERLEERGKPLQETEPQEAIDLLREALDR